MIKQRRSWSLQVKHIIKEMTLLLVIQANLSNVHVWILKHVGCDKVYLFFLLFFNLLRSYFFTLCRYFTFCFLGMTFFPLFDLHHWKIGSLLRNHFLYSRQFLSANDSINFHILHNRLYFHSIVMLTPKVMHNGDKVEIFLFHFLMMATALLCLSSADE